MLVTIFLIFRNRFGSDLRGQVELRGASEGNEEGLWDLRPDQKFGSPTYRSEGWLRTFPVDKSNESKTSNHCIRSNNFALIYIIYLLILKSA